LSTIKQTSAAITGAGSALGRDIALGLEAKGYRVCGTAIANGEIVELQQASGGKVALSICEITDKKSVQSWARGGSDTLGETGVDLLISNAGILTPGASEILPLAAIRREFEVNVFGAMSVINGFLPALRKARGRRVQISKCQRQMGQRWVRTLKRFSN
jgi:NAD(P)-dependent dehydrogenase (short-subunit alcohol dehydrogenase family)